MGKGSSYSSSIPQVLEKNHSPFHCQYVCNMMIPILELSVHGRYFKWIQQWKPNVIDIGVSLTSNVLHIRYKITQEQKRTQVWECIFFNIFVYCTGINVQNLILGFIWQPQEERTLCKFGMNTWSTVQSHFPAWPREQFLKSRDSREAGPVHVVFKSRAHPEEEQWKYSSFLSHFFHKYVFLVRF